MKKAILVGAMSLMPLVSGCKQITDVIDQYLVIDSQKQPVELEISQPVKAVIEKPAKEEKVVIAKPVEYNAPIVLPSNNKLFELIERSYQNAPAQLQEKLNKRNDPQRNYFEGGFRVDTDFDFDVNGKNYIVILSNEISKDDRELGTLVDTFKLNFRKQADDFYQVRNIERETEFKTNKNHGLDIEKLVSMNVDISKPLKILPRAVYRNFVSEEFQDFESANQNNNIDLFKIANKLGFVYELNGPENILFENGVIYDNNPIGKFQMNGKEGNLKSMEDVKGFLTTLKNSDYSGIVYKN